jgi:peroxidase
MTDPTMDQDIVTPNQLDNQYYKNIRKCNVLFTSGAELAKSSLLVRKVFQNALFPEVWERKFAKAMIKMSAIEFKTAANGGIKNNCRVINN